MWVAGVQTRRKAPFQPLRTPLSIEYLPHSVSGGSQPVAGTNGELVDRPRHSPMVTARRPLAPNRGCDARGVVPYVQTTTSLCRLAPTSGALPPVYGPDAPERVGPGRASGAPLFFSCSTSAPARSTREEALHYGATAATTGIAGGAHESQPPRSPWPQRLAVMSAARTCCYAAWRHAARKPKRAPWQAAAQSPTRHCFGSRIGGCSRPRRTGLRHGQRIGPGESRCPAGHG